MVELSKIRNIGIIAHIDAGKTTTSERILYYTGRAYKMGDVDNGNTVMDYLEEERQRGITITSAATTCTWKDHTINLIDTPGHVDFTAEVERSLRVLDGAVGIFCAVGGVEAQSETVWKQADRYHVPRLAFINKMDRIGANFDNVLTAMRKRLKVTPVAITIPWGAESQFCGVIHVIKNKAYTFSEESLGKDITEHPIPQEFVDQRNFYYEQLIDTLAEFDDSIIEKFSSNTLTEQDIHNSIRKSTLAGKITPTLAGSAFKRKGVQFLLDAVVDYLPSPEDVPPIHGINPKNNHEVKIRYDDAALCVLAFKTTFDKHGDLTYIRVYSGKLQEGIQIYNANQDKTERINRLYRLHADEKVPVTEVGPGEIAGILGLKETYTGDTLCRREKPIMLEKMKFPDTVVDKAVEPKTTADKDHLTEVLKILSKDDPTFRFRDDLEHGQLVISGMGELHLEILCNRIQKDHKVGVNIGKPRVSYRETILHEAEAEHLFQKQFGNREQQAYVKVKVQPYSESLFKIESALSKEKTPKNFMSFIEDGIRNATTSGDLAGYLLINIKVTILDVQVHQTNSTEEAFYAAAFQATKDAILKAGAALLEPVMRFQIQTPHAYVGEIISNLGARRAEIQEMETQGDIQIITGKVPIAEMFGYANNMRAVTQGHGSFTMEPSHYAIVPPDVQRKILGN